MPCNPPNRQCGESTSGVSEYPSFLSDHKRVLLASITVQKPISLQVVIVRSRYTTQESCLSSHLRLERLRPEEEDSTEMTHSC